MAGDAAELALRLARNAEAVCRHYLSAGRREGRYWRVGDVKNTPGRSMFVRLSGPQNGKGAAGKWTDAATGEHGDLLDVIRETCGLIEFAEAATEARRFLGVSKPEPPLPNTPKQPQAASDFLSPEESAAAAHRLFAASGPIFGTLAEEYLQQRGITNLSETDALRFHPNCYYRIDADGGDHKLAETWPAMIASVTDLKGTITGVHRTWLDPSGRWKAPVETPRRSMGHLLGNGVRFGIVADVMAAGEGIETMLSLRSVIPGMPVIAALSASHLAAIHFPPTLRRLYIARDNDAAGDAAFASLSERTKAAGIDVLALLPALLDFNDDLKLLGADHLRASLRTQLAPEDASRFIGIADDIETSR
jgi:hypothetical protein